MKPKTLGILAALAAAAAVIAAVAASKNRAVTPTTSDAEAPRLFDGLGPKLDTVATLSLKHGDKEYTIKKSASEWQIAEKGGFPAKADAVRKALVGLAELRQAEEKTSSPERYATLNVQDPDGKPLAQGAQGPTLMTLKDDKGGQVAAAIIGNQKYGNTPGVYIRKPGETKSWLASGSLEVPTEIVQWIDTTLVQIPRDRIKAVTVTQPDSSTVAMSRNKPEDPNFAIADIPQGKELKSPNAGDAVAQAISYLSCDDVAPADQIDFDGKNGGKPGAYLEYRTFDGMVLSIQLADAGGKTWAKLVANYEEPPAPPPPADLKPDQKTPAEIKKEEIKKEVADLNARMGKWAYAIPSWKVTTLATKMSDLLKSDTPPPPPASMEGTTPLLPPPGPVPAPQPATGSPAATGG